MATTRVVLILIEQIQTPLTEINENKIQAIFVRFGAIKAVKIFKQTPTLKVFLEFRQLEDRQNCLAFNHKELSKVFKFKVYPSNKKFVAVNIEAQNPKKKKAGNKTDAKEAKLELGEASTKVAEQPDHPPGSPLPTPKEQKVLLKQKGARQFLEMSVPNMADLPAVPPASESQSLNSSRNQADCGLFDSSPNGLQAKPKPQSQKSIKQPQFGPQVTGPEKEVFEAGSPNSSSNRVLWLTSLTASALDMGRLISTFLGFGVLLRALSNPREKSALFEYANRISLVEAIKALESNQIFSFPVCFRELSREQADQLLGTTNGNLSPSTWDTHPCSPRRFNCDRPLSYQKEQVLILDNVPSRWTYEHIKILIETSIPPKHVVQVTDRRTGARIFVVEFNSNNDVAYAIRAFNGLRVDHQSLRTFTADKQAVLGDRHEHHVVF